MAKARKASLIQTAIPMSRGKATHYETGHEAMTVFDTKTGHVKAIHTPPDALRRVHEVMHARHTKAGFYDGIRPRIADIIEDCRLHMLCWPWAQRCTPVSIRQSADQEIQEEISGADKHREAWAKDMEGPSANALFADFATRLRANAVEIGLSGKTDKYRYPTARQHSLSANVINLIQKGATLDAARLLEDVFFPKVDDKNSDDDNFSAPESDDDLDSHISAAETYKRIPSDIRAAIKKDGEKAYHEKMRAMVSGRSGAERMKITQLPLTTPIKKESEGFRLAKSGTRLYRPALRRPVLPQRIFWKRSPQMPAGAILFDASGSMYVDQEKLLDCCLRSPAATIAYYAGSDSSGHGELCIFAMDGIRATSLKPHEDGNGVDGPALNWLMQHEGPRTFVTDRGFSGPDVYLALARLEHLELHGEVKVYESYDLFKKAFPILQKEAA